MRSSTDLILSRLATIPDVGHLLATFVSMSGPLAVVNIGDRAVAIPCAGFYPPVAGMSVQVERRNGALVVTGPAVPLAPLGVISAGGSPLATVTVGGLDYTLGYRAGYTPVIGDTVEINWATGIIQGKITTATAVVAPVVNAPSGGGSLSTAPVLATNSGRYLTRWWGNDPWASDNNDGAWVYGSAVRNALRGSTPTRIEAYLPLLSQIGTCQIGVHSSGSLPAGPVTSSLLTALNPTSGWVRLPLSFATFLRDNTGGIFVTAGGSGYLQWKGTQRDRLSGALRFQGTR